MAVNVYEIGSDVLLQGYLDLNDNVLILGLSDQAYIQTTVSDSSLDIANDSGQVNIQALSDIVLNAPQAIISNTLVINSIPILDNAEDDVLVIQSNGTVARRSATSLGSGVNVDGITIDFNSTGELEVIGIPLIRTWTWSAGSDSTNVTESYLKGAGNVYGNQSTFVAAFDCQISAVSAMADIYTTNWTAEVHINGLLAIQLNLISTNIETIDNLNVSVNAGDTVSFYCAGNNINTPLITAWLSE
jgi:hypothetical protein